MKLDNVVFHVLFALAMGLAAWLAARPARVDPFDGARVLAYHWVFRLFGWFSLLLPVGIGIGALAFEGVADAREAAVLVLFVLGFGGAVVYLILEATYVHVLLTEESITGLAPWRTPRTIAWGDVVRVRYSGLSNWFILEGRSGETIRVSAYLTGIGTLAQEIRARLPHSIYEKAVSGFAIHGL